MQIQGFGRHAPLRGVTGFWAEFCVSGRVPGSSPEGPRRPPGGPPELSGGSSATPRRVPAALRRVFGDLPAGPRSSPAIMLHVGTAERPPAAAPAFMFGALILHQTMRACLTHSLEQRSGLRPPPLVFCSVLGLFMNAACMFDPTFGTAERPPAAAPDFMFRAWTNLQSMRVCLIQCLEQRSGLRPPPFVFLIRVWSIFVIIPPRLTPRLEQRSGLRPPPLLS